MENIPWQLIKETNNLTNQYLKGIAFFSQININK